MKNILVVFTGGTIGSTACAGVINTSEQQNFKLIQLFQQQFPTQAIQFECLQPLQILSENLHPRAWETLIAAIESQNLEQFDGIIVTHGTDTLAFTAAALSFYFHALNKPLLLVSSNYPLDDKRANGLQNFHCAVEFIRQNIQNGVFVPYQNPQQPMHVHLGTRLASSLQLSGDFISVQSKPYLTFENNEFQFVDKTLKKASSIDYSLCRADFSKRILLIKPYPSLDYSAFNLEKIDAILHDLYHSGTACTTEMWGENHNLVAFLQRCRTEKVPCYLAPALKSPDLYASSHELEDFGAKMLWNLSLEAAYVKLLFAYNTFQEPEKIESFLQTNLALEYLQQ